MTGAALALLALGACERWTPGGGDTDTGVTIDTGAPNVDVWSDADLAPADVTVGVGAVVRYRLRATVRSGTAAPVRMEPEGVVWSVTNPAVADVDDGVVTALAAGQTRVVAQWQGADGPVEIDAWLHIDGNGTLIVTVTDEGGNPLRDAHAQIADRPLVRTDEQGRTSGDAGPGPVTVCAWAEDRVPLCATRVIGRRVTMPLRTRPPVDPPFVAGDVDLSAVDATGAPDALVVGIVAPSYPGDPRFHALDAVLGPSRIVSALGLDVALPTNVVVKEHAESFTAPGVAGARTLWSIATLVPIVDALAAGAGTADPIAVIGRNMGRAVRSQGPITLPEAGVVDAGVVAPAAALDVPVAVTTGPLPAGAEGDEVPILLAYHQDAGDASVIDGLGAGITATVVGTDGLATHVLGLVQQGGLGEGGVEVYVSAPIVDGSAALPDWPPMPRLPLFHPPTTLSSSTSDGDIVRMTGTDRRDHVRDVLAPVGNFDLDLPEIEPPFERGVVAWDVWTVTTDRGQYDAWLQTGAIDAASLAPITLATARASGDVYATP